jgi:hypothetical protein
MPGRRRRQRSSSRRASGGWRRGRSRRGRIGGELRMYRLAGPQAEEAGQQRDAAPASVFRTRKSTPMGHRRWDYRPHTSTCVVKGFDRPARNASDAYPVAKCLAGSHQQQAQQINGACSAAQEQEIRGGRSGPPVTKPTRPIENHACGCATGTAGTKTNAVVGNANAAQHDAQTVQVPQASPSPSPWAVDAAAWFSA